ncbi:MAG: hypothetical protein WC967_13205 [Balneolaceae bacterium]
MDKLLSKRPTFITFSGIDDRTDLVRAKELSSRYPIEFGVLFSESNKDSRYPSKQGVEEIVKFGLPLSAHMCGSLSRSAGEYISTFGPFDRELFSEFQRVQFNGLNEQEFVNAVELYALRLMITRKTRFIFQCRFANGFADSYAKIVSYEKHLSQVINTQPNLVGITSAGLDILCDTSGGKGTFPSSFPKHPEHDTVRNIGYAGGINPDNVEKFISKIDCDETAVFYIDMETGVRTDGWFDLNKVESICEKVFTKDKHYVF